VVDWPPPIVDGTANPHWHRIYYCLFRDRAQRVFDVLVFPEHLEKWSLSHIHPLDLAPPPPAAHFYGPPIREPPIGKDTSHR